MQRLLKSGAPSAQRQSDDNLFTMPGVNLPQPGGGKPLPDPVLAKMQSAFGADFSGVQVHEGSAASDVGALAYTQGEDIHFAPGRYNPDTQAGQSLIGHELTHVVQQRGGGVSVPQGEGAPINADPGLEAEADRIGASAAAHTGPAQGAGIAAQRQGMEEEELLQGAGIAAQRQGMEEEELLQGAGIAAQRQGMEEEDLLQGADIAAQRQGMEEEELI